MEAGRTLNREVEVLHVVAGLALSSGGPSRSVVGLVDHLAEKEGLKVGLITQSQPNESIMVPTNPLVGLEACETISPVDGKLGWSARTRIKEKLRSESIDVVHVHGIWNAVSYWGCALAKQSGRKLVLHPRGMLEPWCLAHKAWKKRIALALYQRRALNSVDLFFATAEQELESIRRLGLRQPVAVVPNGINVMPMQDERPGSHESATRQALFLSRIHPVKGLLNLVQAWAAVEPKGWQLVIAGPNEGNHWEEVAREVARLRLDDRITYVGPVEGEAKADLYRQSDLFVLPTFSENFGIVVAEALAHGLPVITTQGTPWKDLEDFRCGWWIETGVDPLVVALRCAMKLSDEERRAMGVRGRAYVERYDWNRVAEQTAAVYRWMIGVEPKPVCVLEEK